MPSEPRSELAGPQRVGDLMRRDFIHLDPDEDLWSVVRLMGMARVRQLPVTEGGCLVGMVVHRELAGAVLARAREGGHDALVGSISPWVHRVRGVAPDTPLREAVARMVQERLACLPAVDQGSRLVGILTEGDLIRAVFDPVRPAT